MTSASLIDWLASLPRDGWGEGGDLMSGLFQVYRLACCLLSHIQWWGEELLS